MSKWISVEERKPINSNEVLVFAPDSHIIGSQLVGRYFDDDDSWTVYDFEEAKHHERVTYWQPLLEPPKGAKNEVSGSHKSEGRAQEVITDNTQVILNYEQEVKELKARVARLETVCRKVEAATYLTEFDAISTLIHEALKETPKQSLADINIDAIYKFVNWVKTERFLSKETHDLVVDYTNQLQTEGE